jgi:D-arabinose 1-dehydrogenase-like Zn-dependent alcohol dehydrogenase
MIRTGAISPFVGRDITFDEIPEALEAMERRETVGRLVAHTS